MAAKDDDQQAFEQWLLWQGVSPGSAEERDNWRGIYEDAKRAGSDRDRLLPQWAMQYYVAGRLAARAGLIPVHGNLLHHAVEMLLKSALVDVVSPKEMRDKYGHDLTKLWARFKEKVADKSLDRFDATISALHEFEDLRYPDKILDAAVVLALTWKREPAEESNSGTMRAQSMRARRYEVVISDIDGLIIEILDRASLNPKYLVAMIVGDSGRAALMYQNPYAGRWGLDPAEISGID